MKIITIKRMKNDLFRVLVNLDESEEKKVSKFKSKIVRSKDFYWFVTKANLEGREEISLEEAVQISEEPKSRSED